ncbi:aminotransferase class IV [Membranihabitans marinus]|uniref:aminotransferase class IV n=1 Tax=Membranihabitans marinus TaxID=1227546 RepID=UPI001F01B712|nr:aminotransferase class IV [Membranihabitans marinus]
MLQTFNPKNKDIEIWVKDGLFKRSDAKVSVFDSSVQGGDAVWEGIRLYSDGLFCLDQHLNRLYHSAKALAFEDIPSEAFIKNAIYETLTQNQMKDEVHIRLTLTRGEKITSGMDPRLNQFGCCLIVLAEHKPLVYNNQTGIKVISTAVQRNSPRHLDSKIHHNNLLNNILAKIQANFAGVDAGLMLDAYGFLAELNGSNLFVIRKGVVYTPTADACLNGITRSMVMSICQSLSIPIVEKNISLSEAYSADSVFATGSMGELTPVIEIDGRSISYHHGLFDQIATAFQAIIPLHCEPILSLKSSPTG